MFWKTGLLVLAVCQISVEAIKPVYVENVEIKPYSANSRIVSGWPAQLGQHPHQVSVRMVDAAGTVQGCGGSLVTREWIVTAAHCTASQVSFVVRAGLVSLLRPEYISETTLAYNYPTFIVSQPHIVQPNDISLIKLQRPVTYSRFIQPIRIQSRADAYRDYDNQVVVASGFGRTWTNSAPSEILNWVYLRAVSNLSCSQLFGTALITNAAICARFYNVTSQSICQGDSGGPLVHTGTDGVPTLIGVSSFVAGGDFGCHSGLPGGFIRPGPFQDWFQEVTGIDFENFSEDDDVPDTSVAPPTTTGAPPTTTVAPPIEPEESEEVDDSDSSSEEDDEDDPEIADILKKLVVKVKVKVKINNKVKRKVKVKCVDKL